MLFQLYRPVYGILCHTEGVPYEFQDHGSESTPDMYAEGPQLGNRRRHQIPGNGIAV